MQSDPQNPSYGCEGRFSLLHPQTLCETFLRIEPDSHYT